MTAKLDALDEILVEWGHWYGDRARPVVDADGYAAPEIGLMPAHPLARAIEFAPGRKADRETLARGGRARRERMAVHAGLRGALAVAYVDPVPCRETRPDLRTPRYVTAPDPIPRDVKRIEAIVRDLVLSEPEWGYALRARYCQRGDAAEKSAWLAGMLGKTLTVRAYHALLGQAKLVLLGRMSA